ncbi:GGDEF domain-containing protein [Deinococcus planocerae]|uniref:GGDEF domain-containing protein n=1 Tax=Deinococcus planocerae TaxID=1737569 RepID=UPI000C7E8F12|nr:GGDEF domain-containing protein [Deinococcus planocerae]
MRWQVTSEAGVAPELEFRRSALLAMFGCVAVVSVLSLSLSSLWSFAAWEQTGLAALTVKNVALFVWLWRRPRDFETIGLVELMCEGVGGLYKFGTTVLADQTSYGLGGYVIWLILYYFVASLVLRGRRALLASLALLAGLLVIGGLYWASDDIPATLKRLHGNTLVQMYLLHATFIAFLALQDRLLGRLLRAVHRAEGEARFANVDALTGLPNRRQLDAWLAEDRGPPRSVILFDLDHFKRVNDTHGHDAGDRVLQAAAGAARGALRPQDQLGRWGGEEFLVILPGSGGPEARAVAERLSSALAALHHPGVGRVTISCGVAEAGPGEALGGVLKRADEALYAAKRGGRSLVELAV